MSSVRSAALGFFVSTGSRGETRRRGRALALPRAPAVPRHRPLRLGRDRPAVRRHGRRAQRRHRQGEHHGLRADARPAPAARLRRDGRHGLAAGVPRHRPRARGRARGDRDVRGRPAGHGLRRPRGGRLRRPPAGAADHRPRAGDPRHARRRHLGLPRAPLRAGLRGHRGGRLGRPRPDRGAGRADARRRSAPGEAGPSPTRRRPSCAAPCASSARTPSSATSASAPPASSAATSAASPLRVLDAIFGGLSSSRLFQAVREERGLAYSVYSFNGQFSDTGQIGLYLGTRPDNLAEAMRVVRDELDRLRERPAAEEELERARENVKARVILALESTGARMNRLGASLLFGLPLLEPDEIMERIDAVTLDDLRGADRRAVGARAAVGRRHRPRRGRVPRRRRGGDPRSRGGRGVTPRRRGRRRRPDGADRLRRRRGRRRHGADRPRRSGARTRRSPTCSATRTCWSTSRSPTRRSATRARRSPPACTS